MKSAEFEDWLTGIARLSPVQRRQALEALCEAKEVDEGAAPDPGGSGETREPGAWPAKATRERRVREDPLGAVGHGKVERVPTAAGETSSPGAGRTLWRAIAARAADAPSTP